MSQISVNPNVQTAPATIAGGLDVLLGGVEVCEIRAREPITGRRALALAAFVALVLLTAATWARGAAAETTTDHVRLGVIVTGTTALYLIWMLRQVGVVWRFDHKRKTITRRHWLRGMSRTWKSGQAAGLKLLAGQTRAHHETVQVVLVDRAGQTVAHVAHWDARQVDRSQVEAVIGEIRKVMWWK